MASASTNKVTPPRWSKGPLAPYVSIMKPPSDQLQLRLVVAMALKIYGIEYSPSTQRVLVALAEKNVDDYTLVHVDLTKGENLDPKYMKTVQLFAMIPALQDGDLTLFESRAITRYICEKFHSQGTPLYGKTAKERALVNQWLEVESQNYNSPVSTVVVQKYFLPNLFGGKTDDKVVADQLAKLEKILDVYETHLSKNKYLAGDSVSMADLSHLPFTNYLFTLANEGQGITSRKHVNAWWEDISSRPAWKKVLAMMDK